MITTKTVLDIEPTKEEKSNQELHKEIMEVYDTTLKNWEEIRATYEESVRFSLYGEQWTESEKSKRAATGRSVITNNKLATNIRYVVNNFKANPPSIKIHPQGSSANKNTANILDGIIKYIQYTSDATEAYSNALQSICAGGMGAWRVIPRQCEYDETKVELVIERIKDVLSVHIDPGAKKPNFSDMSYCFITNKITKEQFKREYPEHEDSMEDAINEVGWGDKDFVQIAEYWVKKDGRVEQYIINGSKIIYENKEYPGKLIPVVFVTGEDISIGQDRRFKSLISDVIDQQKILNYTKSEIVDSIQKTSKTKYLVDINTISQPEIQRMWNSINSDSFPYLPYDGKNGAPKPDTINPGTIPTAYIEGSKEASEDLQFGMGIPNPSQAVPASQSGKAISLQISQQNLQTYNFISNINLGIRYTGEILLDLISYYYDNADIMQILGVDGQVSQIPVNIPYTENSKVVLHDLTKSAQYKCMVSIGPSYADKRAEMMDVLSSLTQQMPIIGQTAADLIIQNLDVDNAEQIANRIRAGMNPAIVAASNPTNGDEVNPKEQAFKAQMDQMKATIDQLQAELKQATDANQLKIQMDQMKYQHEAEMEVMRTKFKRESEMNSVMLQEDKDRKEAMNEAELNRQKLAHEIASKQHDYTLDTHKEHQKHQNNIELTAVKAQLNQSPTAL